MIASLITFMGASLWALPAAAGALSLIVAWIFGGDWQGALVVGLAVGGALLAYKLLPEGVRKPVAGAILGAATLFFAYRRGVRRGGAVRDEEIRTETDRLIRRGEEAARKADERNADPRNLDEDDGWRRD